MKLNPEEAAQKFVTEKFPNCDAVLLAGSVVRGEGTETSDLDIVIFQEDLPSPYRETVRAFGWPIEVFVHSFTSYRNFFDSDRERARPSLASMIVEGKVIKSHSFIDKVKAEARDLLYKGPELWSEITIMTKRYMLTDVLYDFIGCTKKEEELWIANALADLVHEYVLRTNQRWIGHSKWVYRALKEFNADLADHFYHAFAAYYQNGDKQGIIHIVDEVLIPHGGRLVEGYQVGKKGQMKEEV